MTHGFDGNRVLQRGNENRKRIHSLGLKGLRQRLDRLRLPALDERAVEDDGGEGALLSIRETADGQKSSSPTGYNLIDA